MKVWGRIKITFPETTLELFEYIKSNQPDDIKSDIAVSDEEFYKENYIQLLFQ